MTPDRRLYFDNAATSFPKPPGVYEAIARYGVELGASPGRGSYEESRASAALLDECREALCRLLGIASPKHVIFTLNASDALNLAIRGVAHHFLQAREPVHMITSAMDHNSVLRPLHALQKLGVELTIIDADPDSGLIDPDDVSRAIQPTTRLVSIVHGSNVSGTVQPIGAIGSVCRAHAVPFLVDAAQTAGHLPIDMQSMQIDLLAFPGHKGLLGPLGTGALAIRPGLESIIEPLREGGTGSRSELPIQPTALPDRYEPGSHNTPGLIGWLAALKWIEQRGVQTLWKHEQNCIALMLDKLRNMDGLRVIGPHTQHHRCGVFAIVHDAVDPDTFSKVLETEHGILTRSGLHCAPFAHRTLGTAESGATRLSLGPFLNEADVVRAAEAVTEVCESACLGVHS